MAANLSGDLSRSLSQCVIEIKSSLQRVLVILRCNVESVSLAKIQSERKTGKMKKLNDEYQPLG